MSTSFDELIASIEVNHEMAVKARDKALAEIKATHALAQQEARGNLTPEEDQRVEDLFATVTRKKSEIAGIAKQLENARKAKAEEVQITAAAEQRHDTGVQTRAYDQVARVGREERTYTRESDRKGALFLRDVAGAVPQPRPGGRAAPHPAHAGGARRTRPSTCSAPSARARSRASWSRST
jgi:hypothetical protein